MKEHNNRLKAKKFAEYITGRELREYVARKIKSYVPDLKTVFDGALGSGQLEQFLGAEKIFGVEIQEESYLTALENYPNADIECKSFFNYKRNDVLCDAVIMNPPFSLKFKELSEEEQKNIQEEFEWKSSGVVDDIFVLKSLKYTKRYGFYILFPGVGYRKTELKFRELIGNKLKEFNIIENAFEDTNIAVLFIVVDREKTESTIHREKYDCKLKEILVEDVIELNWEIWEQINKETEIEPVNIDEINAKTQGEIIKYLENRLALDVFMVMQWGANIDVFNTIRQIREICRKYEKELKDFLKTGQKPARTGVEQLEIFTNMMGALF